MHIKFRKEPKTYAILTYIAGKQIVVPLFKKVEVITSKIQGTQDLTVVKKFYL